MKVFIEKLKEKGKKIKNELSSINDKPYIVFHDAYQYFENENSLNSVVQLH